MHGTAPARSSIRCRYLRTIELPLIAGRDFTEQDRKDTPRVAIVNEVVARAFWPTGDAVGSEFVLDNTSYRVVGVVKAAQYRTAAEPPEPVVLVNYWQADAVGREAIDSRTHVRVTGNAAKMLPIVKREILNLDPTVPISEDRPLTEWLAYFFRPVRATAAAVACFAALALLLSAVGLYAVIAANVAQRTREIALRMALGADRRDVGALILSQGIRLTAIGVGIGVGGALAAGRLLAAYLYGVGTHDPFAIGAAVAVLAATSLIASYLPARRAMGLDPIVELRN